MPTPNPSLDLKPKHRPALTLGIALLLSLAALGPTTQAEPASNAADHHPPLPQLVGFDVPVTTTQDLEQSKASLERITDKGANAVRFLVPIFQPHGQSNTPLLNQRPGRGPDDQTLIALIEHARRLGLHTALVPRVAFTRPRGEERIADLRPTDWRLWWQHYADATLHYAQLAERAGVDVFGLADGLDSALDLQQHPNALPAWESLNAAARHRFSGKIALWTSIARAAATADVLDLDFIAVRPAISLNHHDLRSIERRDAALDRAWKQLRQTVQRDADRQGRAALVAGVGLPAQVAGWANPPYRPFVSGRIDQTIKPVPAVQSAGLRSFLHAWQPQVAAPPGSGSPTPIAGVFFSEWRLDQNTGPFDPGFSIQGKPAEAILRGYFFTGEIE